MTAPMTDFFDHDRATYPDKEGEYEVLAVTSGGHTKTRILTWIWGAWQEKNYQGFYYRVSERVIAYRPVTPQPASSGLFHT